MKNVEECYIKLPSKRDYFHRYGNYYDGLKSFNVLKPFIPIVNDKDVWKDHDYEECLYFKPLNKLKKLLVGFVDSDGLPRVTALMQYSYVV